MNPNIRDESLPSDDGVVHENDTDVFCIRNIDRLPPFLMNVVGSSDVWMFVTSNGGLTAGRVDADRALFPYETADKLYDGHHVTGPITAIRVASTDESGSRLWIPFASDKAEGIERNLYKNKFGNQLTFEEHHNELGLIFRYRWASCEEFGIVRTATLENTGQARQVEVLDGFRNLVPPGVSTVMQQSTSCLTDAYKRCEVDPKLGLGLFYLTAHIVDDAYPAEVLRTNVVWTTGLPAKAVTVDQRAINAFKQGLPIKSVAETTGRRGAYFAHFAEHLRPEAPLSWHLVGDVDRNHAQVIALREMLLANSTDAMRRRVDQSLQSSTAALSRLTATADAVQVSRHRVTNAHHLANVLFNSMRGGVFADQHGVDTRELRCFINSQNREVATEFDTLLAALNPICPVEQILALAHEQKSPSLRRLCHEFLPLIFSRRHGDPSRPWNRFSIHLKHDNGDRRIHYEGNWRDIFQNWESLCVSFPAFLENVVAKFVNGTTVDGFNPYRVTSHGLEWEMPDPEDPWANIGYWGDHQIIYLLRLLEQLANVRRDALRKLLGEEIFVYFRTPYRIRSYQHLVKDGRDTIQYDWQIDAALEKQVQELGEDGKLIGDEDGIYHVNLLEKLLVPMLSKLSNFVPEGGIWMNTQRPEWNDANNALVGNGLSMVTLCYLRRYMQFLHDLCEDLPNQEYRLSREVHQWLRHVLGILENHTDILDRAKFTAHERREMMDALGMAFSDYRTLVYDHGFSASDNIRVADVRRLCALAIQFADMSIRLNQRSDGLYHSYNLLRRQAQGVEIGHLPVMLEGQVAALSSGALDLEETLGICEALFESDLYRSDQQTFMLYPVRTLPDFLERNIVPEAAVENPLVAALLQREHHSIVQKDELGTLRFHHSFRRAADVQEALDKLALSPMWCDLVRQHGSAIVSLFEEVFQHRSYTGRSGNMYGYEGIGCIYWHMVSKLIVAIQENVMRAEVLADRPAIQALSDYYFRVRAGLGFCKSAEQYGAFPTDPYSHTPQHVGAQQPGMTGQVKEGILLRFCELGVQVRAGKLQFRPTLLQKEEFLEHPTRMEYYDTNQRLGHIDLETGQLAFTLCQTPIIYTLQSGNPLICVVQMDGTQQTFASEALDEATTQSLLSRDGKIRRIEVGVGL